jgi:hypothetical protein
MSSHQFNDQRMKAMLPKDVWNRFRDARAAGEDVTKDDMDVIAVRALSLAAAATSAATTASRTRPDRARTVALRRRFSSSGLRRWAP